MTEMNSSEDPDFLHTSSISSEGMDPAETDAALFALLERGCGDVLACIFDRYSRLVYSTALRVLHDAAAAEDVMQEVFIQIWQKPPTVPAGSGNLAGWFVLITRNRAIGTLRKRKDTCPIDDVQMASRYDLGKEAEKNYLIERLRTAIAIFPNEQKRALTLAFFEGLTHEEIAARTGDALGTVKSRIRKALCMLRKEFQVETAGSTCTMNSLRTENRPFVQLSVDYRTNQPAIS
jgi:RNA polymerase sigma-70 factor (ECF subfamily)